MLFGAKHRCWIIIIYCSTFELLELFLTMHLYLMHLVILLWTSNVDSYISSKYVPHRLALLYMTKHCSTPFPYCNRKP